MCHLRIKEKPFGLKFFTDTMQLFDSKMYEKLYHISTQFYIKLIIKY